MTLNSLLSGRVSRPLCRVCCRDRRRSKVDVRRSHGLRMLVGDQQAQVARTVCVRRNDDLGREVAGRQIEAPPRPTTIERLLIHALISGQRFIGWIKSLAKRRLVLAAIPPTNKL